MIDLPSGYRPARPDDALAMAGLARATSKRGPSIVVADTNAVARRLYGHRGYREATARAMVKEG